MFKRTWIAGIALGLGLGVGLALLFLVWAVPEFRDPEHADRHNGTLSQQPKNPTKQESTNEPKWRYWSTRFVAAERILAQPNHGANLLR
jgi:hypothetical protein